MDGALARRRRAVAALELGPLWRTRTPQRAEAVDADARAAAIAAMDRAALSDAIHACRACRLGDTRVRAVPGAGAARATLLLVGQAPDADDDATGTAFSGPPGRLLDAMMAAIAVDRAAAALTTHLVKCRPPGDRAPTDDEVACCRPFLDRQVALAGPRVAIALGEPVASALRLAPEIDRFVVPAPATLMAAPERKAEAWAALCDVRRYLTRTP